MTTKILKLEALLILLTSIFFYFELNGNWILFAVLFFTPDLSMIGYLKNKEVGAIIYNSIHNLALALALVILGVVLNNNLILFYGIILSAHIGMDRTLGFGLKETTGFKDTHLGKLRG